MSSELSAWLNDDKLAYIDGTMELDPELSYTLVVTPNAPVATDRIIKLATVFGEGQPISTYVYKNLLGKYKSEQLSGYDAKSDTDVRFKLIPNKFTSDFYGTAKQQADKLTRAQIENPFLSVPSVLDAVTFWETLHSDGHGTLSKSGTFDRTYIRHFDLDPKRVVGYSCVPSSAVYVDGQPYLGFSCVDYGRYGRVAVG